MWGLHMLIGYALQVANPRIRNWRWGVGVLSLMGFINKMYGVDAEVMRRMERRIKEKIYREMIEEEEKQRKKQKEDRAKSREF